MPTTPPPWPPTWADLRHRVLIETPGFLVLHKPAGISVMGERHETDIVRLAADAGETLYPAHRIDKVTSGVVLFAKDLPTHARLTRQFTKRTVTKSYLAITRSTGMPAHATIDLPLSVGRKNRVRVAAPREKITHTDTTWSVADEDVITTTKSYPSRTHLTRLWTDPHHTLVQADPITGRRHQIRVHLAWTGHPIQGDPLFDKSPTTRTCLHAWHLTFDDNGHEVHAVAPPEDDFWSPISDRVPNPQSLLDK